MVLQSRKIFGNRKKIFCREILVPAVSQCQRFCLLYCIKMADEGEKRVKHRLKYKEQCFALSLNVEANFRNNEKFCPRRRTLKRLERGCVFVHHKDLKKSVAVLDKVFPGWQNSNTFGTLLLGAKHGYKRREEHWVKRWSWVQFPFFSNLGVLGLQCS